VNAALPSRALGSASEPAVLALAMHGDSAAFSELVRRRQSWLRNLLRRLCRDPSLADDLAQQTLLQAWRTLASLKAANAFTAWLRRVAINVWLQHLRGAGAHGWIGESATVEIASEPAAPAAIGLQLDLDRALARLRPEVRVCVVLAYHEKLSHSEIGAATGYPLGTVKSHIKRGAEQLRSLLDAYSPKEPPHGR
jgi:RNA polymerase sigma-70 factor (ECF subfamily)